MKKSVELHRDSATSLRYEENNNLIFSQNEEWAYCASISDDSTEESLNINVYNYNDDLSSVISNETDLPELNIEYDASNLSEANADDPYFTLKEIKSKNMDRLIIAHLNINFISQKFEALKTLVHDKIDILMISETKIDESFPIQQFAIDGFSSPFRLDRNCHGGGIILYVRQDLPCKELNAHNISDKMETIFIEVTLRKTKWILMGGYNPKKENISHFLSHVTKGLDKYICDYDNILLLGDFNAEMSDENMEDFCDVYNLHNLIDEPTCYKNASNPSSIDVMLTNRKESFQNSMAVETGLSDHHKMTLTVLKTYVKKTEPIIINYCNYKNFDDNIFREELIRTLKTLIKQS